MRERLPKSEAQFKFEQRTIGRLGNKALRAGLSDGSEQRLRQADKYERLAERFNGSFIQTTTHALDAISDPQEFDFYDGLLHSAGPLHGYYVAARGMRHAMTAYSNFCDAAGRQKSVEELVRLLEAPSTFELLIARLASIPGEISHIQEAELDLSQTSYAFTLMADDETKFEVITSEDGTLNLRINPEAESQIDALCPWSAINESTEFNKCPALVPLMPQVWQQMVDFAANDPNYFALDLDLA